MNFALFILFSGATLSGKPGSWESLRKQARTLENDIDAKLVAYSKLGTNYNRSKTTQVGHYFTHTAKAVHLGFAVLQLR